VRGAVAQDEHHQPLVVAHALADERAVVVDGLLDAVERAVHRRVLDPAHAEVGGGVPRGAELGGLGVVAQRVGAVIGAADAAAGGADRAGLGERLDEGGLDLGLPAVRAAAAARDGGEGERGAVRDARRAASLLGIGGRGGGVVGHESVSCESGLDQLRHARGCRKVLFLFLWPG
jgi:hypothetical protein